MIRILTIGDVVGEHTTTRLSECLWNLRSKLKIDTVIANGENASSGNGLSPKDAKTLLMGGVDVITSGNHIWKKNDLREMLDESDVLLRPANYPSANPGKGYTITDVTGYRLLTVSLLGTVYMEPLSCPFETLEKILDREHGSYDISVVDFHAEATSEKMALAYEFDGRVNAVVGTHTHVQTADEKLLPGGTAFITDLGMCGPDGGILGVRKDEVIRKLRTRLPVRFAPAEGDIYLCGAIITLDGTRTVSIERIREKI
ncbi:MAG: TIGR00282 family metallophosphoesterase [Clostridia bacterium]|nr:TIGR00282 family metallophosphoesterase [Clostridia bacterium]